MPGNTEVSPTPSSNMVIFDSSSATSRQNNSILISCRDGPPEKLAGFVKREWPRKGRQASPSGEFKKGSVSEFNFVSYTASPQHAGSQIKRLVRSHAMLNYRQREKKRKDLEEKSIVNCTANHAVPDGLGNSDEQYVPNDSMTSALSMTTADLLPQEIKGVEPFDVFPIKIEPYMLELLCSYTTSIYENMYTIEKQVNINPAKDYWLPMALQDAAFLHALLFYAHEHAAISTGRKEGVAAVIHLKKAIEIVNGRLREPVPSITDATIAVICTFAHTEIMTGNRENGKVHMRGLKQMLRHRGGMQALESNRLLQSKIRRADLCGSLDAVQSPYFEYVVKELPRIPGYNHMTTMKSPGFGRITSCIKVDGELTRIIHQIQDITYNLDMFYHQAKIHPLSLREAITLSQYFLLSLKPQQSSTSRENLIHEMVRLGLLTYLANLLNESPPGVSVYDELGARLKCNFIEIGLEGGFDLEFSLWIMFMAASVLRDPDLKNYFMVSALGIMRELGVSCWEDAETVFKSFFWVEKIHRGIFRPVWYGMLLRIL